MTSRTVWITFCIANATAQFATGQVIDRAASQEYLQATSPLKSGGTVTVTATPGRPLVTSFSPDAGWRLGPSGRPPESASPSSAQSPAEVSSQSSAGGSSIQGTADRPGATQYSTGQFQPSAPPPYPTLTSGFDPYASTPADHSPRLPTLGLNSFNDYQARSRSGWCSSAPCSSRGLGNGPGYGFVPGGSVIPGIPQQPGNGQFQPLVRLQNMPPGTYTGQGVLGQPKAYVDGQPARNLLRYFSPW